MVKNSSDGARAPKNANLRLRMNIIITNRAATNQKTFSTEAKRLDELPTSNPSVGLKRKVKVVYGALYAIQKYLSNLELPA